MKNFTQPKSARTTLLAMVAIASLTSCNNSEIEGGPCTTSLITERLSQSAIDKMDILLAIDNSRSMGDKQQILALAIPDLVQSLLNPRCIDETGQSVANQPLGPLENCPAGSMREFPPILDMHLGVISSSIGGHGADSCPNADNNSAECAPNANTTNNDHGHLLARMSPCGGADVPTYQGKHFLAWDPRQSLNPPGEMNIEDGMGNGIVPALRNMVLGAGQIGCGYESQLESIYRFLVDPNPYETIVVDNFKATPMGTDADLLAQRKAFLRPDSLLAVVMLTDENDCSIKEYGQFYYVGQLRDGVTLARLPRARQECATDPNDPCCKSCGQPAGSCPNDPTCDDPNGGTAVAQLSAEEDDINLRCWDQKRRFGIDFLYPTDRYVQAFSNFQIADREGNLVPNPIFSDLDPQDSNSNIRDPSLVLVAGIVGVPWQDIARDKTDLKKGFKDANELATPIDDSGITAWDLILGDPKNNIKPNDPRMVETYEKRPGLPDSSTPLADPIHGHDWTIAKNDLQYACTFPLLPGTERDCTNTSQSSCDCTSPTNDNPLCAQNPGDSNAPTLQVRAKAYPSLRPLSVIRSLGSQGILGSVCPAQLTDMTETAHDFGYRAAIGALRDRLIPTISGQCLPRTLLPNSSGQVECLIVEGRKSNGSCECDGLPSRVSIAPGSRAAAVVVGAKKDPLVTQAGLDCFCEIPQSTGAELTACQQDASANPMVNGDEVDGWCYVDASASPGVGNPQLVDACPSNDKRILRFVGQGAVQPGATLFINCGTEVSSCN